jgi:SAM-dependent methyltransferase
MSAQQLLSEISDFCRTAGLAESTFGRAAINDGKLVSRLRNGGRITTDTLDKIRGFMVNYTPSGRAKGIVLTRPAPLPEQQQAEVPRSETPPPPPSGDKPAKPEADDGQRNFRFYDNRQKYLLFVNTCSEKWEVANRVSLELTSVHPKPPAFRLFDAGVGDGSVLAHVMRSMHDRYPTMPFYVVGKEISLEDVRLSLRRMVDRFCEHPSTVLVLTNLQYADAPWLTVKSLSAASSLVWHEVRLTGDTAHTFDKQITDLEPFLAANWNARVSPRSGNSVYDRPVVLVIYREDHKFALDPIIPRLGQTPADYDLVIASQPYRARASVEFKAKRVIAPLTRALRPGGRLIGIHSCGGDPGMEIIDKVWPNDNPFATNNRHEILKQVKHELGPAARDFNFNANADTKSHFRYHMHTLPTEVEGSIGTSTAFAAWNAAIYVAQVEDDRLGPVVANDGYLKATKEVLQRNNGLWFYDESYVISRRRE